MVAAPAERAAAPVLRFGLDYEGSVHALALPVGDALYIGRAAFAAVILDDASVSGMHVELTASAMPGGRLRLWARDLSRNGTAIVEPVLPTIGAAPGAVERRRLNEKDPEELFDGTELIVPLKRKAAAKQEEGRGHRFVVRLSRATNELAKPPAGAAGLETGTSIGSRPRPVSAPLSGPTTAATPARAASRDAVGSFALPAPVLTDKLALDISGLPDIYESATKAGRWQYEARLGEGGLGVVYRALDSVGQQGEVAVKVLKRHSKTPHRDARHAFAMHRESQWSLWRLHNQYDERYVEDSASIFARYLEDHTGFSELPPAGFDAKRRLYEAPGFNWDRDGPVLPVRPYVVMELIKGEPLQAAIDRERRFIPPLHDEPPALSIAEKRAVLLDAARALEYLSRFGLIHRDFRGCNMHLVARAGPGSACRLKVLDLGVMISAEDGQEQNSNLAVQAFRRRGETEEKRKRYDWLPWEVRGEGGIPAVNFAPPTHSFDVFSLGVLVLHLLVGKTEARVLLDELHAGSRMLDTSPLGLDRDLVHRMLGKPEGRPHPSELLLALRQEATPSRLLVAQPTTHAVSAAPESAKVVSISGSRSRSRSQGSLERKRTERRLRWQSAAVGSLNGAAVTAQAKRVTGVDASGSTAVPHSAAAAAAPPTAPVGGAAPTVPAAAAPAAATAVSVAPVGILASDSPTERGDDLLGIDETELDLPELVPRVWSGAEVPVRAAGRPPTTSMAAGTLSHAPCAVPTSAVIAASLEHSASLPRWHPAECQVPVPHQLNTPMMHLPPRAPPHWGYQATHTNGVAAAQHLPPPLLHVPHQQQQNLAFRNPRDGHWTPPVPPQPPQPPVASYAAQQQRPQAPGYWPLHGSLAAPASAAPRTPPYDSRQLQQEKRTFYS